MSVAIPNIEIAAIDRVEVAVEPWPWDFAATRRDEIDRNFARRQRDQPALWNGRVLLLHRYEVRDRMLRGACFETDYASFLAWRDWAFPDPGIFNIFAAAALRGADGAWLLGEMGPTTAAAGAIYFPCGTPDPEDISADGALDVTGSVTRELLEETGLNIGAFEEVPGWTMVRDRGFMGLMKVLTAGESAESLRDRVMRHLAADPHPELCDMHIVRSRADFDKRMPRLLVAFVEEIWRQEALR
jgi:hypothetical protein